MKHAVTAPMPPLLSPGGRLEIHRVPGWVDNIVWIAVCVETRQAAFIDGPEAGPALDYCAAHGVEPTLLLNTHTHPDHIGINRELAKRGLLADMQVFGSQIAATSIPGITTRLVDGDAVHVGAVEGAVLLTEGHLDGHLTYLLDGAAFCGDTLFAGGCGYMFHGPPSTFHGSLQRLGALPPETLVCCAHEYTVDNLRFAWLVEPGNAALAERIRRVWAARARGECTVPSTIGEERATNPFVRTESPEIIASIRRLAPQAPIETGAERFAAVRRLKDQKLHKQLGDDALPLA